MGENIKAALNKHQDELRLFLNIYSSNMTLRTALDLAISNPITKEQFFKFISSEINRIEDLIK